MDGISKTQLVPRPKMFFWKNWQIKNKTVYTAVMVKLSANMKWAKLFVNGPLSAKRISNECSEILPQKIQLSSADSSSRVLDFLQ
jgi:hypothetical protein